jgi:type I restriction enzyme M protein
MPKPRKQKETNDSGLNFEAQLWAAADTMRGHMDASEYKHVCLGLIFLKYISDAFEARWRTINAKSKSPEIGTVIDNAMGPIERENPTLAEESRTLAALLSKLLSGELRVKEAHA